MGQVRDCIWGSFSLKSPITAHHHLCLDIFEGTRLLSILKILVENKLLLNTCKTFSEQTFAKHCCLNILCILFIKDSMMNVCKKIPA